ncbi:MAG TPA: hypothetical protein VGC24_09675 [Burkholderiaceae bacterium]
MKNRECTTFAAPQGAQLLDFVRIRVERTLRNRARYRYVHPQVLREGESLRIESPCCSRNVDKAGGVIDIALFTPAMVAVPNVPGQPVSGWRLYARDHTGGAWVAQQEDVQLDVLLEALCTDKQRLFWP